MPLNLFIDSLQLRERASGAAVVFLVALIRTLDDGLFRGTAPLSLEGAARPDTPPLRVAVGDLPERIWDKPSGADPRSPGRAAAADDQQPARTAGRRGPFPVRRGARRALPHRRRGRIARLAPGRRAARGRSDGHAAGPRGRRGHTRDARPAGDEDGRSVARLRGAGTACRCWSPEVRDDATAAASTSAIG